jgi:hypothetical protein
MKRHGLNEFMFNAVCRGGIDYAGELRRLTVISVSPFIGKTSIRLAEDCILPPDFDDFREGNVITIAGHMSAARGRVFLVADEITLDDDQREKV